jgi:hypothetical protein
MLLLSGILSVGCSSVTLHPITNKDILKIPTGTVSTFPGPMSLGYGPPVTSVTRDAPAYIISAEYMEQVMKVKVGKK